MSIATCFDIAIEYHNTHNIAYNADTTVRTVYVRHCERLIRINCIWTRCQYSIDATVARGSVKDPKEQNRRCQNNAHSIKVKSECLHVQFFGSTGSPSSTGIWHTPRPRSKDSQKANPWTHLCFTTSDLSSCIRCAKVAWEKHSKTLQANFFTTWS